MSIRAMLSVLFNTSFLSREFEHADGILADKSFSEAACGQATAMPFVRFTARKTTQ